MIRNRKIDSSIYGETEYLADIILKDKGSSIILKGKPFNLSKDADGIRLSFKVINYPMDSYDWENEMYNTIFDSCKGTDWSKVEDIII